MEHEKILTTDDEQRIWEESSVPPGVPFVLAREIFNKISRH
jgi:hypothetical protein